MMWTEVIFCDVRGMPYDAREDDELPYCDECYTLRNTIQDTAHYSTSDSMALVKKLVERVREDERESLVLDQYYGNE